ncbi:hypothetical protein L1887_59926 [Cichorium endivia]|nr:hypothetical protein L1887_59926 [Cichorium endivia]
MARQRAANLRVAWTTKDSSSVGGIQKAGSKGRSGIRSGAWGWLKRGGQKKSWRATRSGKRSREERLESPTLHAPDADLCGVQLSVHTLAIWLRPRIWPRIAFLQQRQQHSPRLALPRQYQCQAAGDRRRGLSVGQSVDASESFDGVARHPSHGAERKKSKGGLPCENSVGPNWQTTGGSSRRRLSVRTRKLESEGVVACLECGKRQQTASRVD